MSIGPVVVSLVAVALGAAIGLFRGPAGSWLGPIRTFGLVSVLGLILVLLLPEALSSLGLVAVLLIAAGYALPTLFDRLSDRMAGGDRKLGAELGYWVVLVHQVCDGLALSSESAAFHGIDHWDGLIAMSVHTIPLTTLVVATFSHWRGPTHAVLRAVGIAGATLLGVAVIQFVPPSALSPIHPWIAALASGMLLHMIASGPFPTLDSARSRALDAMAAITGVALVGTIVLGAHSHSDAGAQFSARLLDAFFSMSMASAPALLLGLVAGAAIGAFGAPIPKHWLSTPRAALDAGRGALIGTPLPVCSCGVLPVSQGLRNRGASTAFVLAFLVATPEIGVDAFALSTQFLGWELSFIRVGAALLLAVFAGIVGARLARSAERTEVKSTCCHSKDAHDHHHGHDHAHDHDHGSRWSR
ncbi:MAG: permease, partial [Myxococcota bacterium]